MGGQKLQPPGREQVIGGRRVRAVHRNDVHPGQHLVEALPIGRLQLLGDARADRFSVVVVDLQAERPGAAGDRLADPAHADDSQPLAGDTAAHHPGGRPAVEVSGLGDVGAFDDPAGHGHDQRHGQVSGVLGEDARGVGDGDAARVGGGDVDVIDARPEIGDQLQPGPGLFQQLGVEPVGNGGGEHVATAHRIGELRLGQRLVGEIQLGVEQFPHPSFHRIGKFAGDDDFRLAGGHGQLEECVSCAASPARVFA